MIASGGAGRSRCARCPPHLRAAPCPRRRARARSGADARGRPRADLDRRARSCRPRGRCARRTSARPAPVDEERRPPDLRASAPCFPFNLAFLHPLSTSAAIPDLRTSVALGVILGRVGYVDGFQIAAVSSNLLLWGSNSLSGNVGVKFGSKVVYSILSGVLSRENKQNIYGGGITLGVHFPI